MKKLYVLEKITKSRDWGEVTYDLKGAYPSFEAAKDALFKIKEEVDKSFERCGDAPTSYPEIIDDWVSWKYIDLDGLYTYYIETVDYHDENN